MTDFEDAITPAVDDAVKAAGESTRLWFDTMARMVDGAVDQTTTADSLVEDLTLLAAAGARDAALAMSTWITVGQAVAAIQFPVPDPKGPP